MTDIHHELYETQTELVRAWAAWCGTYACFMDSSVIWAITDAAIASQKEEHAPPPTEGRRRKT